MDSMVLEVCSNLSISVIPQGHSVSSTLGSWSELTLPYTHTALEAILYSLNLEKMLEKDSSGKTQNAVQSCAGAAPGLHCGSCCGLCACGLLAACRAPTDNLPGKQLSKTSVVNEQGKSTSGVSTLQTPFALCWNSQAMAI